MNFLPTAAQTRRAFLGRVSQGVGAVALASLLGKTSPPLLGAAARGVVHPLPLPQRAKRVIWLTMAGGPSQFETFDPKPKLAELHGEAMPESLTRGQQLAQLQGQRLVCHAPQFPFAKFGKNRTEICSLFPHIGSVVDDICLIRSMTTDAINHDPAHMFMNTGSQIAGRPSMGAWVNYGLGSEAENLPGFVVMVSTGPGRSPQPIATRQWSSGFLPSRFQGVQLHGRGDAVHYLANPGHVSRAQQRTDVTAINALNRQHDAFVHDPEIATRIAQYELAFQLQASVPELTDLRGEDARTLALYGCAPGDGSFAANCLLARRLAERGVRFIQLYHRDWDHHSQLREEMPLKAQETDRASAALITDLKQRGMLDDTLVIWGGEFGRTPVVELTGPSKGRDHNPYGFTMWMAGGGVKGGTVYGATDNFGFKAEKDVVPVHDLHATILNLMGFDHKRLTYRYAGRDFRLTDVYGNVVPGLLA